MNGKLVWISTFVFLHFVLSNCAVPVGALREGDVIFQISRSEQSRAIQLATGSEYSHMGIIYVSDGEYYVYEAIQPVRLTPLANWVKRGEDGHYVVKRLKDADKLLVTKTEPVN